MEVNIYKKREKSLNIEQYQSKDSYFKQLNQNLIKLGKKDAEPTCERLNCCCGDKIGENKSGILDLSARTNALSAVVSPVLSSW